MTGWRLGWLVLPAKHAEAAGKLLEFNTSCAPVFIQHAGQAALAMAATTVPELIARLKICRDTLLRSLQMLPGVRVAVPPGGLYAFFRVEGEGDSLAFAKRMVAERGRAWAWRRVRPLGRKARGGCAGVLRPVTPRAWGWAWTGWHRRSGYSQGFSAARKA